MQALKAADSERFVVRGDVGWARPRIKRLLVRAFPDEAFALYSQAIRLEPHPPRSRSGQEAADGLRMLAEFDYRPALDFFLTEPITGVGTVFDEFTYHASILPFLAARDRVAELQYYRYGGALDVIERRRAQAFAELAKSPTFRESVDGPASRSLYSAEERRIQLLISDDWEDNLRAAIKEGGEDYEWACVVARIHNLRGIGQHIAASVGDFETMPLQAARAMKALGSPSTPAMEEILKQHGYVDDPKEELRRLGYELGSG